MAITRTPLCSVDYCPAPRDPDAHVCPHCQGTEIQHQHIVPRGMGGSQSRKYDPANVVMICPWLHEEITLHRLSDGIIDVMGERVYRVWDIHNNTITEYSPPWIQGASAGADYRAASLVAKAPSAGALIKYGLGESGIASDMGLTASPGPLSPLDTLPPDLTYEQWVSWGEMLGRAHNVMAWRIAEWVLYGEAHYGEKYAQAMDATGKSYSTLSTYVSTVKAYEFLPTASNLSMSVLAAIAPVARSEPEKAKSLLLTAEAESWTGEDARAAVMALRGEPLIEPETVFCDMGYRHKRREA